MFNLIKGNLKKKMIWWTYMVIGTRIQDPKFILGCNELYVVQTIPNDGLIGEWPWFIDEKEIWFVLVEALVTWHRGSKFTCWSKYTNLSYFSWETE